MSPRLQRMLLILLMVYYTQFGGTAYTEFSPPLRIFHQVFTVLLLAVWLLDLWRRGRGFPVTPLDGPLLATGVVWLLAAVFALDPRVSLEYYWPILAHILGFYFLVDLMRRGRQRWVMEALLLVATVVVLMSAWELVAWYCGLPIVEHFVQGWPQVFGLTLPPIFRKLSLALNVSTRLGNFVATLIPLVAAWAMTVRQRDLRIGAWLLTGGLTVVLLLTGSRGGLIGLGMAAGVWLLIWLLRDETRVRFPAALRSLLDRRVLLSGAAVAGIVAFVAIFALTLRAGQSGDTNRLDIWRSAVETVRDHAILGVGPYQFGSALRWYGNPARSASQAHIATAHNLPLHTLAESGVLGLSVAVWLGVAFMRMWWLAWRGPHPGPPRKQGGSNPGRRRRLEGALAALVAFGVHSLVDTFPLTQSLVPVLIVAAYTLAGDVTRVQAVMESERVAPGRRAPILPLLALIVVAQIAFLPVHAGGLAHGRALAALGQDDPLAALIATREARAADPALNLYALHEAYILGLLADEDPETYLDEAIAAHEDALQLNPTWDEGWHNLAALYAQAGRYDDAVEAEQSAIAWNPVPVGYTLKLGEYHEALGRLDEARAAYFDVLERRPALAASGFWTDPDHPQRAAILAAAVAHFAADPEIGLRLVTMAGDLETATAIASSLDPATASPSALRDLSRWAAAVNDDNLAPCPACYYERVTARSADQLWRDHMWLAELGLAGYGAGYGDGDDTAYPLDMTVEQAARAALFISEGQAARSWYVLARLAERDGADDATINTLLARSVPPIFTLQSFTITVYGRMAGFNVLPQAQTPFLTRQQYEPAFWLAERLEAAGAWERARFVYEVLLEADPYLWEVRQHLDELP